MAASKDSGKLINNILQTLSKVTDSDSEVSILDLNLLENLNTNQSLNYIKLQQKLDLIQNNSKITNANYDQIHEYKNLMTQLDSDITKLSKLVEEMDDYTIDLAQQVKSRKRK